MAQQTTCPAEYTVLVDGCEFTLFDKGLAREIARALSKWNSFREVGGPRDPDRKVYGNSGRVILTGPYPMPGLVVDPADVEISEKIASHPWHCNDILDVAGIPYREEPLPQYPF